MIGLSLDSATAVDVVAPLAAGSVEPLHIVATSVPVPTLVNGRPL